MYVSNEEETFFFVGNAEMTELFKCEKSKTTCCSPKSAIKEEKTRLQRIKYQIRRKDTEIQNTQFIEVRYDIHSSYVISIYLLHTPSLSSFFWPYIMNLKSVKIQIYPTPKA